MKNFSQLNLQLVLLLLICFAKDLKAFQAYNKGKVDKTESTDTQYKKPKPGFFFKSCLSVPDSLSLQVVYKSTNPELKAADAKAEADAKAAAEKEKPLLIQECDPDFWARKTREAILTEEYLEQYRKEKARKKAEKEQEAEHKKKLSASNTPEKPNTSPANK
jgi:hypothetical protein